MTAIAATRIASRPATRLTRPHFFTAVRGSLRGLRGAFAAASPANRGADYADALLLGRN